MMMLAVPQAVYAMPAWAKVDSQTLIGDLFRIVCAGTGPSVDLARQEAELSCKASASSKLVTSGQVTTFMVESEKDLALHQEVREEVHYRNLNCSPEKEEVESGEGQYTVWLRCRFDLSKAEVLELDVSGASSGKQSNDSSSVADRKIRSPNRGVDRSSKATLNIMAIHLPWKNIF